MPRRITPTRWRTQEKIFLADGFTLAREESSHRSYVKPGILRPVVIPKYKEVPVSIIRNNMTTANMSRVRYLELLDNVEQEKWKEGRPKIFIRAKAPLRVSFAGGGSGMSPGMSPSGNLPCGGVQAWEKGDR